jgi:hypothetical protein
MPIPGTRGRPTGPSQSFWQATLWGHRILCHEQDQHLYLDHRSLDVTPIEFGLIWVLLRQALYAQSAGMLGEHTGSRQQDESSSRALSSPPDGAVRVAPVPAGLNRHLQQIGIVPVEMLLLVMTSNISAILPVGPDWTQGVPATAAASTPSRGDYPATISAGRRALTSHLDRLRAKLRPHGLDIGTVLLLGRAAQGYLLVPLSDVSGNI